MEKSSHELPFKMMIEACHMPAFYLRASDLIGHSNAKFNKRHPNLNLKAMATHLRIKDLTKPIIFQTNFSGEKMSLVAIPLRYGKVRDEIIFLSLGCTSPMLIHHHGQQVLADESWHELNNPIAIITMTLSRAKRLKYLRQKDVDSLIDKTRRNFTRIEDYLRSQLI